MCNEKVPEIILMTYYKALEQGTETGIRICRSQLFKGELGQKFNKRGS